MGRTRTCGPAGSASRRVDGSSRVGRVEHAVLDGEGRDTGPLRPLRATPPGSLRGSGPAPVGRSSAIRCSTVLPASTSVSASASANARTRVIRAGPRSTPSSISGTSGPPSAAVTASMRAGSGPWCPCQRVTSRDCGSSRGSAAMRGHVSSLRWSSPSPMTIGAGPSRRIRSMTEPRFGSTERGPRHPGCADGCPCS